MKSVQKIGAFSAFYLAFAYLIGIIAFLFVLDYPSIVEPSQKVALLVEHQILIYITNILLYVFFGFFLIFLVLSLYNHLKSSSPLIIQTATVIGIIWAGLLIASGMVANAGISPAIALFSEDPSKSAIFWLGIESVANGLGGANGEILGGFMTLLVSIAGIHGGLLPKGLNYFGVLIGVIGIVSTFPGLKDLSGVFGMTQMLWYIWLGISLLNIKEK